MANEVTVEKRVALGTLMLKEGMFTNDKGEEVKFSSCVIEVKMPTGMQEIKLVPDPKHKNAFDQFLITYGLKEMPKRNEYELVPLGEMKLPF